MKINDGGSMNFWDRYVCDKYCQSTQTRNMNAEDQKYFLLVKQTNRNFWNFFQAQLNSSEFLDRQLKDI